MQDLAFFLQSHYKLIVLLLEHLHVTVKNYKSSLICHAILKIDYVSADDAVLPCEHQTIEGWCAQYKEEEEPKDGKDDIGDGGSTSVPTYSEASSCPLYQHTLKQAVDLCTNIL
ncbi:hypothetical protein PR048_026968 [Dryococelus australis]|uniref:Uncharacterized protein n=1 Tax=Dryococelus australis TaxID=614101 RepID=A0ABQ9GMU1_9NEOP|nr:hypothetical protein PR048_026968 [Dryococelus australis]